MFVAAGAINILVQVVVMPLLGKALRERTLAMASFSLLAIGFMIIGLVGTVPALAAGIVMAATGIALARPTLVAALSLIVPATSQGAAMGMAQSMAALINIVAPIAGGAADRGPAFHRVGHGPCRAGLGRYCRRGTISGGIGFIKES